ncbi:MAG: TraB/GumN family protein [Thermoplasmata archaeon]
MITLIGVGHVFAIANNVKEVIRSRRPEVVCLELDAVRYRALSEKRQAGSAPLQYRLLAYLQRRMALKFGTEVGDEMMAAVEAAGAVGAKIALIDMDASRVFALLWKKMSVKEKLNLFGGALLGLFVSKKTVEREMEKYEEHEDEYIATLGTGFPTVKEVLIDDRNKFMAERLSSLAAQHLSIVAVVGDGHIPGLLEQLKQTGVEAIRLKDLRKGQESKVELAEYSGGFWYHNE